jgi:holo-ACP synthase/triphosphoribosyl-dephospho-CoA synthase
MGKTNQILYNVLDAREKRASLRSKFVKNNLCTLSLSLNIAGYPKSNPLITSFFSEVLNELKPFLLANRIDVENNKKVILTDKAGDFFIVPFSNSSIDIIKIKELTETFESTHRLGRLIDIDIFNEQGLPISSGKEKSCYFCGENSAISCMRNKRHTYNEIREKISIEISNYLNVKNKELTINRLISYASKAILYEISLSPKPGLVSFHNSGSHADMNFFTFLNSSASLTPFFREFCLLGYNYSGKYEEVLGQIRHIGLRAEKAMFEATHTINTHKGIIFLFGVSLFSISKLVSEKEGYNDAEFRAMVMKICKNMVANELVNTTNKAITNGEKVYVKYGIMGAGVRGEVEQGFPSVFHKSQAYFEQYLTSFSYTNQHEIQHILQTGLLKIMAVNNDSNILHRSNLETLIHIQTLAKKAIANNIAYAQLNEYCLAKNISPGGSADLLSVALLLHFVKNEKI